MANLLFAILLSLPVLNSAVFKYRSYDGYKVYEATPTTLEQYKALITLSVQDGYDAWKEPTGVGHPVHISVPPQETADFHRQLQNAGLSAKVLIEDVGKLVRAERAQIRSRPPPSTHAFNYNVYHTLAEIDAWIDEIAANYSSLATVIDVGTSYEGRTIRALRISTGVGRPAYWIDAGIHAREWVAPATMMYIVKEFLGRYGSDAEITNLLNTFDWYCLPVFNVDGYEYTWTTDRMWRKTRSPNEGSPCVGTDPNRNWDVHWGESGASMSPCSDAYCGSAPFSEVEVRTVVGYINTLPLAAYFAYHAYGQMYMTPYGYTRTLPPHYTQLKAAGDDAIAAINALPNGEQYRCDTIAALVGLASGSSVDYAYMIWGVQYSYGIELRDEGQYGFILPENQIQPTAEESIHALITIAGHVAASLP